MYLKSLIILLFVGVIKVASQECRVVGRFPIYQSNCRSYLWCTRTSSGNLVTTVALCPRPSRFNPAMKKCVSSTAYICPEYICEGASSNSSSNYYRDPNDTRNTSYVQCIYDSAYKAFVPRLGECPSGQIFVVEDVSQNNLGHCSEN